MAADSRRPDRVCVVRRGLRPALLAAAGKAAPSASASSRAARRGRSRGLHRRRRRRRGEAGRAHRRPGPGRRLLSLRPPARRQHLRRCPHEPAAGIPRGRPAETRPPDSTPSCRSPTSARWRPASPTASSPAARRPCWPGLFSGLALLLTAIGTYGVLSYAVAQRRREIGLRMALGARPEQIRGQFVSLALRLLAGGTILGLLGAWLTGQAMQAVLFQVPALNVATLAAHGRRPGSGRRWPPACCRRSGPPASRRWRRWRRIRCGF